jgi:23S rRNA (adenine2503-C2)-methyltransferase
VLTAVRRMNTELGIGARHITISTVGLAPKIRQLAKEKEQFTLAVSLHEADDLSRSKIMPINKRFPIEELLEACEEVCLLVCYWFVIFQYFDEYMHM